MPRITRKRSRKEHLISIEITCTGDLSAAFEAIRRALDSGSIQSAALEGAMGVEITNIEVK